MLSDNNSMLGKLSEKRTEIMGLAMLMVIMYHFALHFGFYHSPIIIRGDIGVDLFFFLSGYGCAFSVCKHTTKEFYVNRIKRIVPIYLIIEFAVILCNYVFLNRQMADIDIYRLFCISFFTHDDLSVWYIHASILLYLFTPFMAAMLKKYGFVAFCCLMPGVAIAIYLCTCFHHQNINLMLYRFVSYTMGLLCAFIVLGKLSVSVKKLMGGNFVRLLDVCFTDSLKETRHVGAQSVEVYRISDVNDSVGISFL